MASESLVSEGNDCPHLPAVSEVITREQCYSQVATVICIHAPVLSDMLIVRRKVSGLRSSFMRPDAPPVERNGCRSR
ncbi:hypothetical protein I79_015526 [Cricetulus griseus]|uniref:Uncharacterized protein n=1 Tax=Cricetulus griseus TaxID=10029 RepID=G3HX11_CRIGR|nr:hypothetical protein I79_015526 [Cricetulus griseus]